MRKDVHVEDIAPNLRYVHLDNYQAATITIPGHEVSDFVDWYRSAGLEPLTEINVSELTRNNQMTFIFTTITRKQVMHMKLAWARHDTENPPRSI